MTFWNEELVLEDKAYSQRGIHLYGLKGGTEFETVPYLDRSLAMFVREVESQFKILGIEFRDDLIVFIVEKLK